MLACPLNATGQLVKAAIMLKITTRLDQRMQAMDIAVGMKL